MQQLDSSGAVRGAILITDKDVLDAFRRQLRLYDVLISRLFLDFLRLVS